MPLSPELRAKLEANLKALLNETTTQSNDTKTKRERKQEFERRFGARTPTAELVARIEAAERIVWVPCGYVLFVRQATCRNCRATERCLDLPELFLQQRKAGRDESNTYLYTPCKEIEFGSLPRRRIIQVRTTPFCLSCFESFKPCQDTSSERADTSSRIENSLNHSQTNVVIQMQNAPLSGQILEALPSSENSKLNGDIVELGEEPSGSPSETEFGSECGEREFAKTVTAEG